MFKAEVLSFASSRPAHAPKAAQSTSKARSVRQSQQRRVRLVISLATEQGPNQGTGLLPTTKVLAWLQKRVLPPHVIGADGARHKESGRRDDDEDRLHDCRQARPVLDVAEPAP